MATVVYITFLPGYGTDSGLVPATITWQYGHLLHYKSHEHTFKTNFPSGINRELVQVLHNIKEQVRVRQPHFVVMCDGRFWVEIIEDALRLVIPNAWTLMPRFDYRSRWEAKKLFSLTEDYNDRMLYLQANRFVRRPRM